MSHVEASIQRHEPQPGLHAPSAVRRAPDTLRLMSYNIQTGIETRQYRHYITRSWKHFLPHSARQTNLDRIANTICQYDIVGLQEVDSGSFRSGFVNQIGYLAEQGQFPYWHYQTNRRIGRLARHSNGLLSRFRPIEMREHKLPGMIPGRGALVVRFGGSQVDLYVVLLHLALSQRARANQMHFVSELISDFPHVVVMGDFNCDSRAPELDYLLGHSRLMEPLHDLHTYPSWRPQRNIDHILISNELEVREAEVLDYPLSDHLPITMEIALPADVELVA